MKQGSNTTNSAHDGNDAFWLEFDISSKAVAMYTAHNEYEDEHSVIQGKTKKVAVFDGASPLLYFAMVDEKDAVGIEIPSLLSDQNHTIDEWEAFLLQYVSEAVM